MLSLCPLDISVGVGAFVIGLSQISSFLSNDVNAFTIGCGFMQYSLRKISKFFKYVLVTHVFSSYHVLHQIDIIEPTY